MAARVFVQYLKSRPKDEQVKASLQFLLTAMGHIKKKNPLTESFLVQLEVDLAGMVDEGLPMFAGHPHRTDSDVSSTGKVGQPTNYEISTLES